MQKFLTNLLLIQISYRPFIWNADWHESQMCRWDSFANHDETIEIAQIHEPSKSRYGVGLSPLVLMNWR